MKRFELIVHGTGDDQWEKEERRNRETFQNSTFDEKNDESDAVSSVDQSERGYQPMRYRAHRISFETHLKF